MYDVTIQVSATGGVDAAKVAQWVGEALSNLDVVDSRMVFHVHSVNVEEQG